MDVYLVPAGPDRYQLYAEPAAGTPAADHVTPAPGWRRRLSDACWRVIQEGERAPDERAALADVDGRRGRWRRWVSRLLAAALSEGRLLRLLRSAPSATLTYPDDLDAAGALAAARMVLAADRRKHAWWFAIEAVLAIASLPFALVPGPNVLGYYFVVRAAVHYLSFRGAARGLSGLPWSSAASPELTTIRRALGMDAASRSRRVSDAAAALRLTRLVPFVEALAGRSS